MEKASHQSFDQLLCNNWTESFLCCILIVISEETGKKIWIHHYICCFIVIVQRKQPLQCLTAVWVASYQGPNFEPVECSGLLPAEWMSHMRQRAVTWLWQAWVTQATCTSSCPPNRARSRVNRNSSMDQAHGIKDKTLLHHINSYRPGFPHLLVWCCWDCGSGTGCNETQFQIKESKLRSSWVWRSN